MWPGCPEEAYERKANCEGKSHWSETKVGWEWRRRHRVRAQKGQGLVRREAGGDTYIHDQRPSGLHIPLSRKSPPWTPTLSGHSRLCSDAPLSDHLYKRVIALATPAGAGALLVLFTAVPGTENSAWRRADFAGRHTHTHTFVG